MRRSLSSSIRWNVGSPTVPGRTSGTWSETKSASRSACSSGTALDPLASPRQPLGVAQLGHAPDLREEAAVVGRRVVAQDVHVEADRLLHEAASDAAHAHDRERPSRHLVAEPRLVGVPGRPLVGADLHLGRVELPRDGAEDEERELRGGVGEDVGRVRERDAVAVGGGAVDVVEPDRHLRHDLEGGGGAGGEHLLVDAVAQRRHESVDAGAHLLEDELLRRRLDLRVDLEVPPPLAQARESLSADVARREDPVALGHGLLGLLWVVRAPRGGASASTHSTGSRHSRARPRGRRAGALPRRGACVKVRP